MNQLDKPEYPAEKPERNTKEKLKYLKSDIEKDFPADIKTLLGFFYQREQKLQDRIMKTQDTAQIKKNQLVIADIYQFQKIIYQHATDQKVILAAQEMNELYTEIFNPNNKTKNQRSSESEEVEESEAESWISKSLEKLKKMTAENTSQKNGNLEQRYLAGNEQFDDTLDQVQTNYLSELAITGNPDALFEQYVTQVDRYQELINKILNLPKKERDDNIDVLLKTLDLYTSISQQEYLENANKELAKEVENILNNQQEEFSGVRGFIQRSIEKGGKLSIDGISNLLGNEESIKRSIIIKAIELGIDLSKPTKYSQEIIAQISHEVSNEIASVSSVIDINKVTAMQAATLELKANPDQLLNQADQEKFQTAFKDFFRVTTNLMKKIIASQTKLLHQAYILSHGKENSEFPADKTYRSKLLSIQGKDAMRLLQIYSPCGIFLPETVTQKSGSAIHLQSAYQRDWFKEHQLISTGLQAGELAAGLKLAYGGTSSGARFISKRILITKVLGKVFGKPINKLAGLVGAVYLGVETEEEIRKYRISNVEKEIFEILNQYTNFADIPAKTVQEIRILTLRNEIEKRRGLFESIGFDLKKVGMGGWDRFMVGNVIDFAADSGSMKKSGTFREAVLATNRKLVLLNMEPFEIA